MSTGAIQTLLRALVDDASLFPPGNLPMARALPEHRDHRSGPYAPLLGRFLCPASRRELRRALPADAPAGGLQLGIILDTDPASLSMVLSRSRRTRGWIPQGGDSDLPQDHHAAAAHQILHELSALPDELRHDRDGTSSRCSSSCRASTAGGRRPDRGPRCQRQAAHRRPDAEAFPSEFEVAEFIRACVSEARRSMHRRPAQCGAAPTRAGSAPRIPQHLLATVVAVTDGRIDELVDVLARRIRTSW
jgi:hypothetical protein